MRGNGRYTMHPYAWCAMVVWGAAFVARPAAAQPAAALAASPYTWDISYALESMNRLDEARMVIRETYTMRPAFYDACMRLAWLSFQMKDYDEAAALYRRAETLAGATDAARIGLAESLVASGYAALNRGALANARARFIAARQTDSTAIGLREGIAIVGIPRQLAIEVWKASLSAEQYYSTAGVTYAQLPLRLDTAWSVRIAYRSIGNQAIASSQPTFFGSQKEWYAGVEHNVGRSTLQAAAFVLTNVTGRTPGGAVGWHLGGRNALHVEGVAMSRPGAFNAQITPMVSRWLGSGSMIAIGTRFTTDSGQVNSSVFAEGAVRSGPLQLDVRGHAGREQKAFDLAGPTILSFGAATLSGGTATLGYELRSRLQLFVQGQYERLENPTVNGRYYRGMGMGLRYVATDTRKRNK